MICLPKYFFFVLFLYALIYSKIIINVIIMLARFVILLIIILAILITIIPIIIRFVILHGTDTLAYTSSALSFMLENLGKPVIVTGSDDQLYDDHDHDDDD